MISYWKRLWATASDSSIPGNSPLAYRGYDWLGALLLLVLLTVLVSLTTWVGDRFFVIASTFFMGWQFAWLGHVRYARRKYREEHDDN